MPEPKTPPKGHGLTKKVGPLPIWMYGAIVAAVVIGLYLRARSAESQSSSDTTDTQGTVDPSGDYTTPSPYDYGYTQGTDPGVYPISGGGAGGGGYTTLPDDSGVGIGSGDSGQVPVVINIGDTGQSQTAPANGSSATGTPTPGFHPGHSRGHDYYLSGTGWVSRARFMAGSQKKQSQQHQVPHDPSKGGTILEGFHAGHSKGHEYYLKGVGYVSQARYNAAKRPKTKGK